MKLSLFKVGKEYKLVPPAETGDVLEFNPKYGIPEYIGDVNLTPIKKGSIQITDKRMEIAMEYVFQVLGKFPSDWEIDVATTDGFKVADALIRKHSL